MKIINRINGILIFNITLLLILLDFFAFDQVIELKRILWHLIIVTIVVFAIAIVNMYILYPIINKHKKLWYNQIVRMLVYSVTNTLTYIMVMLILSLTSFLHMDLGAYLFGAGICTAATIFKDIREDMKLNQGIRKKQNPGQWYRGKEIMKLKILSSILVIALILSVTVSLYLFATTQTSTLSLEMEQVVLEGSDNLYYAENTQSIIYDGNFITSWRNNGELYYQRMDVNTAEETEPIKISGDVTKPKKVQFRIEGDHLNMFVLHDVDVDQYILDIETGETDFIQDVAGSIQDFAVLEEGLVFLKENDQLEIWNNDGQQLFIEESGVEHFEVYDNDGQSSVAFKGVKDGVHYIRLVEMKDEGVRVLHETEDFTMAEQDLKATYIKGEQVAFLLKKDNRNKNTSFLTFYISNDYGKTFTDYFVARNYVSGNYIFESVEGTEYSFYEVLSGNIYFSIYNEDKMLDAKQYTNSTGYPRNFSIIKDNEDIYTQWAERGTESKTLYYASSNEKVVENSLMLDDEQYTYIAINTVIVILTSIIPSFILLCFIALSLLPVVVILKLVLRDNFTEHASKVSFFIGGIYVGLIGVYLSYYLERFYDMNILSSHINTGVFIGINVLLMCISYYLASLREEGIKFHNPFEKLMSFIGFSMVGIILWTMPYVMMDWFGYSLF
ncbi:hypothetical protein [Vallitalea okinawensis]|uniref:hypothetical protein n=1 Tax=Vallitalea okinawensis TaxID=2078660 RepID=UPI000CFCE02D|nr:hypothetical protein [Vallitalea okinawensis]